MADARRPILLLVNPAAGGKPTAPSNDGPRLEPEELRDQLVAGARTVNLRALAEGDDPGTLAAAAATDGWDVVVAGGDGTVRPAAAALVGTDATIGVIPRGSWNNIATGWGIPRDERQAVSVIAAGAVQTWTSDWPGVRVPPTLATRSRLATRQCSSKRQVWGWTRPALEPRRSAPATGCGVRPAPRGGRSADAGQG